MNGKRPLRASFLGFALLIGLAAGAPALEGPFTWFFLTKWGSHGAGLGQFDFPRDAEVDANGHVWIADNGRFRVQRFDSSGAFLGSVGGTFGTGAGELTGAWGIAVSAAGKLYVADISNHRVSRYDISGSFERMWGWGVDTGAMQFEICTASCQAGLQGSGNGQFTFPTGVAIDAAGNVFVSDDSHRVQKFDADGNFVTSWGSDANVTLFRPRGIEAGANVVWVMDGGRDRVVQYDSQGNFIRAWGWGVATGANQFEICTASCAISGIEGSGTGQFNAPGEAALVDGILLVSDAGNNRVQAFDAASAFPVGGFGTAGSGDGEFNGPWGLAVDQAGDIYVVDNANHRVQKFGRRLQFFIGAETGPPVTRGGALEILGRIRAPSRRFLLEPRLRGRRLHGTDR